MRIAVANDHAGLPLKRHAVALLAELGHEVIDVGTQDDQPVDFPVVTQEVTGAVVAGGADRGVLVCGTGVGAAIAANKVAGIRAAVIHDAYSARQCVEHDDVNVACVGAWIIGPGILRDVLTGFLDSTVLDDPDIRRRIAQLAEMDSGRLGRG